MTGFINALWGVLSFAWGIAMGFVLPGLGFAWLMGWLP